MHLGPSDQKRVSDTLGPELQVDVTCLTQLWVIKRQYSEIAVSDPNG